MHEDDLLAPWFEHLVGSLDHVSLFDFHTHIGVNDPDGFKLSSDELIARLEGCRIARRGDADARARRIPGGQRRGDGGG